MKRGIQETNGRWETLQRLEDTDEVGLLIRQNLLQRRPTTRFRIRQNHLANRVDPVAVKEHVFRAGQTDSRSPKSDGVFSLLRRIRIRPNR